MKREDEGAGEAGTALCKEGGLANHDSCWYRALIGLTCSRYGECMHTWIRHDQENGKVSLESQAAAFLPEQGCLIESFVESQRVPSLIEKVGGL